MAKLNLDSVYNHYLTSYVSKDVTQADTHKKEDLKSVYKSIVKLNQKTPLFLLPDSDMEGNAVALKEEARQLEGTLSELRGSGDQTFAGKPSAYSSDEGILSVSYIGDENDAPAPMQMSIKELAREQVNTGTFLANQPVRLDAGNYVFDTRVGDQTYEFQFSIGEGETNREVQDRIARLINKAGVSLTAEIVGDDAGRYAVQISSNLTGIPSGNEEQFTIYDALSGDRHGAAAYFGLDQTSQTAANSLFEIDGELHSAGSNHFTLNGTYEVELHDITGDDEEPVTIGIKDDHSSLIDHTHTLVDGYNNFLDGVGKIANGSFKSGRILSQMKGIGLHYQNELEPLGFQFGEDGKITLDDALLSQAMDETDNVMEEMKPIRGFVTDMSAKMNEFMLDPMKFADRPVVNYKNPAPTFPNPYITSEYSGMMFNNYC